MSNSCILTAEDIIQADSDCCTSAWFFGYCCPTCGEGIVPCSPCGTHYDCGSSVIDTYKDSGHSGRFKLRNIRTVLNKPTGLALPSELEGYSWKMLATKSFWTVNYLRAIVEYSDNPWNILLAAFALCPSAWRNVRTWPEINGVDEFLPIIKIWRHFLPGYDNQSPENLDDCFYFSYCVYSKEIKERELTTEYKRIANTKSCMSLVFGILQNYRLSYGCLSANSLHGRTVLDYTDLLYYEDSINQS